MSVSLPTVVWSSSSRAKNRRRTSSLRAALEVLEQRIALATITVTGTGDTVDDSDGVVTLREAILAANNNAVVGDAPAGDAGLDTIEFDIDGAGPHTISLNSVLPTITEPLTINGYSQTDAVPNSLVQGNNAVLQIEINGNNRDMFVINAADTTIRGLVLNRSVRAIQLFRANSATIVGNFIGTDAAGTADLGNSAAIQGSSAFGGTNLRIGGVDPADRNLISGNQAGINLPTTFPDALIQGNYIGTNRDGTAALANDTIGIFLVGGGGHLIGGTEEGAGNVISGNGQWGIRIDAPGPGIVIQGNLVGTNAAGDAAIPNSEGIRIQTNSPGGGTLIGGTTAAAANVVSGNNGAGIFNDNRDERGGTGNTIQGNFIGTDRTGTLDLGNGVGIVVVGSNNTVGGTSAGAGNVIAFSGGIFNSAGVEVAGVGNSILGNSIFNGAAKGIVYPNGSPPVPTLDSSTATSISGRIPGATAGETYRVEFFATPDVGQTGFPALQGKTFLGALDIAGSASFILNVPGGVPLSQLLTATATSQTTRSTSEFSLPLNSGQGNQDSSNLSLSAFADPPSVAPGQDVIFRFEVVNPPTDSAAANVVFTTQIPANMTFVSIDVPGAANATTPPAGGTGQVRVTLPTLGADETLRIILVARVNVGVAPGTGLTALGSVTSDTTDPNLQNNSASASATVAGQELPTANLRLTKTASRSPAVIGQDLTYEITLFNDGPDDVTTTVELTDQLPAGVTFVSATDGATPDGSGRIVFTIPGIPSGDSLVFQIVVRPAIDASLTNSATVSAEVRDPNTQNNTASVTSPVIPFNPDLVLTKATADQQVRVGDSITYVLSLSNRGFLTAEDVTITDTLPSGVTFVSASGGVLPNEAGVLVFAVGDLARDATAQFTIIVRADSVGTIFNTAVADVGGESQEHNPANNSATASIPVLPQDDVPPTVLSVQRYGFHRQSTYLVVTFSEPMDPAAAANPGNYVVFGRGPDHKLGTPDDVRFAPASVSYDPATNRAIVLMSSRLKVFRTYRLVLDANGLTDIAGNPLDGNGDGTAGGDAVILVNRRNLAGRDTDAPRGAEPTRVAIVPDGPALLKPGTPRRPRRVRAKAS